jgi:acyl carrier protein
MKQQIIDIIREVLNDRDVEIRDDTSLVGQGRLLDSMGLVQVCLRLEDLADDQGFSFDWTSESTLSRSRSVFRNVGTLCDEFTRQRDAQC